MWGCSRSWTAFLGVFLIGAPVACFLVGLGVPRQKEPELRHQKPINGSITTPSPVSSLRSPAFPVLTTPRHALGTRSPNVSTPKRSQQLRSHLLDGQRDLPPRNWTCIYTPLPTVLCMGANVSRNAYHDRSKVALPCRRECKSCSGLGLEYLKEPGLRTLRGMFERLHCPGNEGCALPDSVVRNCTDAGGKASVSCDERLAQLLEELINPCVLETSFAGHLQPRSFPRPESKALRKRIFHYDGFPFVDCGGFRSLGDWIYETDNWLFGKKHIRFDPQRIANRSVVYFHLEGRDLHTLRRRISEVTTHFFLVTSCVDMPEFPPWLLDNPFVLKIFAVNIPRLRFPHPKLVAIPLGIRHT
eukprot:RCo047364